MSPIVVALALVLGCGAASDPPVTWPSATAYTDRAATRRSTVAPTPVPERLVARESTPARAELTSSGDRVDPNSWAARKPVYLSARGALRNAIESARSCRQFGEERGVPKVWVTFGVDGGVTAATIDQPFDQNAIGRCILDIVRKARIPAFSGEPVDVSKVVPVE